MGDWHLEGYSYLLKKRYPARGNVLFLCFWKHFLGAVISTLKSYLCFIFNYYDNHPYNAEIKKNTFAKITGLHYAIILAHKPMKKLIRC